MHRRLVQLILPALWMILFGLPAQAVIIASGDGTGNTSAPPDDPGWSNVARVGVLTGVYLGNGWVLTAHHVGAQNMIIGGGVYEPVAGSRVQLQTYGPAPEADLLVFQIVRDPGLPDVAIRSSSAPPLGSEIVMIGLGKNRGGAIRACTPARDGWTWDGGNARRWGTNVVENHNIDVSMNGRLTRAFSSEFSRLVQTQHEAQAANGDSGGAVFVKDGATWELAGIMFAIDGCTANAAVYGDLTYAADLSYYSNQIDAITSVPACDDGVDQDGDGLFDYPDDPGCDSPTDAFETSDALPCDDGIDNDSDGFIDFPDDIGCAAPEWALEDPECSDDVNNDGDGLIDWDGGPAGGDPDPQCVDAPYRNREAANKGCGLGVEIVTLLPLLLARARRRQTRRISRSALARSR